MLCRTSCTLIFWHLPFNQVKSFEKAVQYAKNDGYGTLQHIIFNGSHEFPYRIRKQTSLKNGVSFISLGLGLFTGHMLAINYDSLDTFITCLAMLLLFGGIGFMINYMIIKKWNI